MEQRNWTHSELPEGIPSAAAYRLGCRCDACRTHNSVYMKAYRHRKVPMAARPNGSPEWHAHRGKPSSTTARTWGCPHESCLAMAGLFLDEEGVVRLIVTKEVDPLFGVEQPRKPARKR